LFRYKDQFGISGAIKLFSLSDLKLWNWDQREAISLKQSLREGFLFEGVTGYWLNFNLNRVFTRLIDRRQLSDDKQYCIGSESEYVV